MYISGAVRNPGVYSLSPGDLLDDALALALAPPMGPGWMLSTWPSVFKTKVVITFRWRARSHQLRAVQV